MRPPVTSAPWRYDCAPANREPPAGLQVVVLIADGAHHLDLMWRDGADPPSALAARRLEERMIARWCEEWRAGGAQ